MINDKSCQFLGFGARNEYAGSHAETQSAETGVPQDILNRLVLPEFFDDNFDFFSATFVQNLIFVQDYLHGREAAHLFPQNAGQSAYLFGRVEAIERVFDISGCLLHDTKIAKGESRNKQENEVFEFDYAEPPPVF